MTGRRWAIIAAEAAVVGLVILVVYLTLLRPDGDSPLFDVDVPGDGQRIAQGPNGDDRDRTPDGRDRPPFAPPQARPPGGGDSPTDDQYLDTLARLNAELNAGDG